MCVCVDQRATNQLLHVEICSPACTDLLRNSLITNQKLGQSDLVFDLIVIENVHVAVLPAELHSCLFCVFSFNVSLVFTASTVDYLERDLFTKSCATLNSTVLDSSVS